MHNPLLESWPDLAAPGDRQRGTPDAPGVRLHRIETPDDPDFAQAFAALEQVFGPVGELEPADVLRKRLRGPRPANDGHTLHYRLAVLRNAQHQLLAVRDHTVIAPPSPHLETVVHLSHALVLPEFRKLGLGALLRTAPLLDARLLCPPPRPITLVAEMEHPAAPGTYEPTRIAEQLRRLDLYERAGFAMLDPFTVQYAQPCFTREPDYPVVPLRLILRRVDRENLRTLPAHKARKIVAALYAMYAADLPEPALRNVQPRLDRIPNDGRALPLLPPTLTL